MTIQKRKRFDMEWNDKQTQELMRLDRFFYDVARLNNSNNIIENLQSVMKRADVFKGGGQLDSENTLWRDLYEDCIKVRQARKNGQN